MFRKKPQPRPLRQRVYYEEWQMSCCGAHFAVGDHVTWTYWDGGEDREWISDMFDDELSASIDHFEHHCGELKQLPSISGLVVAIQAAYMRYDRDDEPSDLVPVAGTGRLARAVRTGETEQERDGLTHVGWVVDIDEDLPDRAARK